MKLLVKWLGPRERIWTYKEIGGWRSKSREIVKWKSAMLVYILNPANSEDFFERIHLDPILASCLEYWLSNAFSKLHDLGCSWQRHSASANDLTTWRVRTRCCWMAENEGRLHSWCDKELKHTTIDFQWTAKWRRVIGSGRLWFILMNKYQWWTATCQQVGGAHQDMSLISSYLPCQWLQCSAAAVSPADA